MKNLSKRKIKNLKYENNFDIYPIFQNRVKNLKDDGLNLYHIVRYDHPWTKYIKYHKLAFNIINKHVNKNIDDAYFEYCIKTNTKNTKIKEIFWKMLNNHFIIKNKIINKK
jgi:hypothetical protein